MDPDRQDGGIVEEGQSNLNIDFEESVYDSEEDDEPTQPTG